MVSKVYQQMVSKASTGTPMLAILIDPEEFDPYRTDEFLRSLPKETNFLFVGGSTTTHEATHQLVVTLKEHTPLPVIIFPGDHSQVTQSADALLFLSLLSGRNPAYLIGEQVKAVPYLKGGSLEVIPTGYLLIDGGNESAVERVSKTEPIDRNNIQSIVDTAMAGMYLGMKLIYLEAGSGAAIPLAPEIIAAVKSELTIPLIVGGGIRTEEQRRLAFKAGADLIVMGTAFETKRN